MAAQHTLTRAVLSQPYLMNALGLFSAVDVGNDAYWWDYGQLRWYMKYNAMLAHKTEEAKKGRDGRGEQ